MKILYLVTKSEIGGAQTHVFDLAKHFKMQGHEIAIMSSPGGWLAQKSESLKIKYYPNDFFINTFNPAVMMQAGDALKECLKDFQPDIVHCHSSFSGIVGRMTIKNRIPTFFTAHGWSFNDGVPWIQKVLGIVTEKICAKYSEKIICCSNFVKELGMKYKIAPEEKFAVIYNGVQPSEVNLEDKFKNIDIVKIVMIARLAEPKNPFLLINAYDLLDEETKNKSQVTIIGDGPQTKILRDLVRDNNLFEKIKFTGMVDHGEISDYLKNAHIFALPSKWEGFPYTIIEAMNYGLAIIASDVGGIKEAVSSDCGILIKEDDSSIWAENLAKLINNFDLIKKMGENSYRKLKDEFDIKIMFDTILNLYKNK